MRPNNTVRDHRAILAAFLAVGLLAICRLAPADDVADSTPASKLPTWADVKTTVDRTLLSQPGYRPGDILSQRQVASVLAELKDAGWEVEPSRKLLSRVPADAEFLVRALRAPQGTPFMRRLAAIPGGYDRVDRLGRIPNGQQTVQKLIDGPDGHKLIGYLAEARGGKELGAMLGRTPQGVDFNEATGRIYTSKQLLAELEELHAAAANARQ